MGNVMKGLFIFVISCAVTVTTVIAGEITVGGIDAAKIEALKKSSVHSGFLKTDDKEVLQFAWHQVQSPTPPPARGNTQKAAPAPVEEPAQAPAPSEAETGEPVDITKTEEDILAVLLETVPDSEFAKAVETIDGMSEKEKLYYKSEYAKAKAQYKAAWSIQKTEYKIQNKVDSISEEDVKKAQNTLKAKKAKAQAKLGLKKLKAQKKTENIQNKVDGSDDLESEDDILAILLTAMPDSEFAAKVETVDNMSAKEKLYYKNEFNKTKIQHKMTWSQQKTAYKRQMVTDSISEEDVKKAQTTVNVKKAKAETKSEINKRKALMKLENLKKKRGN